MAKADLFPLDPAGELLAVLQIESKAGVENIDEIASLPGVGAIFLGPSDLSLSYGLAGQGNHPTLVAAMQKVLDACARNNVPCGRTSNAANVAKHLEEGHSFLTIGYWNDAGISTGPGEGLKAAHEASGRSE
jgi:4-hydroxy-2-oxoheptanedioate aldolase